MLEAEASKLPLIEVGILFLLCFVIGKVFPTLVQSPPYKCLVLLIFQPTRSTLDKL